MKILHLFSDWKWTGPAEPCLEMVKGLIKEGVNVSLAPAHMPFEAEDTLKSKALKIDVPLVEQFKLKKHYSLIDNFLDVNRLSDYIRKNNISLIHTHRRQDHLIGGIAAKRTGIFLVRSSHDGVPVENEWRNRKCLKRLTHKYCPVSHIAAAEDQKNFDLPDTLIEILPPAIDAESFDPKKQYKDMKATLNIPKEKVLVGIVARMQRHRRFDVLLQAFKLVADAVSNVHFVIIGRGTNMKEVAEDPAKELGLESILTFAGYHRETYTDMLAALDIKVFLVPGSDGSCRALRQALSLGIPVIGARRGMIPELIEDCQSGFVVEDSPENLAEKIKELVQDECLREKMSGHARHRSVQKYSLTAQSQRLIKIYEDLHRSK